MPIFGGKGSEVALFDSLLNKATSHLNLETEWGAILNICDLIRQQDVSAKYVIAAIRKKLATDNPHSLLYALQTLESIIKNCGTLVVEEVFSTCDFLDNFRELVHKPDPIKPKVLELVQIWATAFGSKYKSIDNLYRSFKNEGYSFPALRAADAMFEAEIAPEWKEKTDCHRCRSAFTTFKRRHHCRSCGNSFCNECSSKQSIVPRYGIEKEVRVCDTCYEEINSYSPAATSCAVDETSNDDLTDNQNNIKKSIKKKLSNIIHRPSSEQPAPGGQSSGTNSGSDHNHSSSDANAKAAREKELELKEKEELELALAISASEAEIKEKNRGGGKSQQQFSNQTPSNAQQQSGSVSGLYSNIDTSDLDPELARYLNRNYWERKSNEQQQQQQQQQPVKALNPSAPVSYSPDVATVNGTTNGPPVSDPSVDDKSSQREEFLRALTSSVDIFMNRMKSNSVRGRSIATDSTVQTLFMTLNAMHPQLIHHMHETEQSRNEFEELQDKLAQLRDAREALNALREEHSARRRAEEEERERQRYAQMMQKLEVMRQKKQEFMEYQRQAALQRMQEQEREYQMRMEAQKQRLAMEQYRKQFPYSSGAYQQHFVSSQVGQPVDPNVAGGLPFHGGSLPPGSTPGLPPGVGPVSGLPPGVAPPSGGSSLPPGTAPGLPPGVPPGLPQGNQQQYGYPSYHPQQFQQQPGNFRPQMDPYQMHSMAQSLPPSTTDGNNQQPPQPQQQQFVPPTSNYNYMQQQQPPHSMPPNQNNQQHIYYPPGVAPPSQQQPQAPPAPEEEPQLIQF